MDNSARIFPNTNGLVERALNVADILELTRHSLRGEAFQKVPRKTILDGKEQIIYVDEWVQVSKPVMSTEGVESILSNLTLLASSISGTSNLPIEKVEELAYITDIGMVNLITKNSFRFRIDSGKMRMLLEVMRNLIYALAYRSVDGWMLGMLTSMTTRVEETSPAPQPQRSPLSPMRLFGR